MNSGFVVFVLIAGGGGGGVFFLKKNFFFSVSNRYTKHIFNLIRNRFFSTIIHRGNGCSNMKNKMNSNTSLSRETTLMLIIYRMLYVESFLRVC